MSADTAGSSSAVAQQTVVVMETDSASGTLDAPAVVSSETDLPQSTAVAAAITAAAEETLSAADAAAHMETAPSIGAAPTPAAPVSLSSGSTAVGVQAAATVVSIAAAAADAAGMSAATPIIVPSSAASTASSSAAAPAAAKSSATPTVSMVDKLVLYKCRGEVVRGVVTVDYSHRSTFDQLRVRQVSTTDNSILDNTIAADRVDLRDVQEWKDDSSQWKEDALPPAQQPTNRAASSQLASSSSSGQAVSSQATATSVLSAEPPRDSQEEEDEVEDDEPSNEPQVLLSDADDEQDGNDGQGNIHRHKRLGYAVISQMTRMPRHLIKFPRDVCAKRVRDVFRFRGLRYDPALGVPRSRHVLLRSIVINTYIQWIRIAGSQPSGSAYSENEVRYAMADVMNDLTPEEQAIVKKVDGFFDDADVHGADSVKELVEYAREVSDHVIRSGASFEPDFPGSLVTGWQNEKYRWRNPLGLVWMFDAQAEGLRNDSQSLAVWQKRTPLLPMYTFTVAGDGDCLMHSAILADCCIVERLAPLVSAAAGAPKRIERIAGASTKSVPSLPEIAEVVLKASRSAMNGRVLSADANAVSVALHSYRVRSVTIWGIVPC